jgi:hypothetical protein
MRTFAIVQFAVAACLTAATACVAAPQIVLSDPKLPLWEMRPLDRHVYVLSLEGEWQIPPQERDGDYHLNIQFPDGSAVEHRPTYDKIFRQGEVQVLLTQYQYENHLQKGDKLRIFITKHKPDGSPDDQEVISNRLDVAWPFDREVARQPPKSRFSEPEPIDAFHPAGAEPIPQLKPTTPPNVEEPAKPKKSGPEK